MQKDIVYIYSLSHPITQNVAYVGKTDNLNRRYKQHCYGNIKNLNLSNWIKNLHDEGLQPIMSIIETCSQINWEEREKYWISYYGLENLLNIQEGGAFVPLYPVKKRKAKDSVIKKDKNAMKNYIRDFCNIIGSKIILTFDIYKLILKLNNHGSINSALSQFKTGKIKPKISNIEASYLNLFMNEKTPHELFGDCLNEYNKVQEIKKQLIK